MLGVLDYVKGISSENLLLYPNRPDEKKGIFEALEVVSKLVWQRNRTDLQLLIPLHIDLNTDDGAEGYYGDSHYNAIRQRARELNIEKQILFHPWIPNSLMPQYYSLGKVTLSIGKYVEAFGSNASVESVACNTPVIASRVGAQRYTFPDTMIPKIDYGDTASAVSMVESILTCGFDLSAAREHIKDNYDYKIMLAGYENVITKAKPLSKIEPFSADSHITSFRLAPWCYFTNNGEVYSDYQYGTCCVSSSFERVFQNSEAVDLSLYEGDPVFRGEIETAISKNLLVRV